MAAKKQAVPAWAWAVVGAVTAMLFVIPVMLLAISTSNDESTSATTTTTVVVSTTAVPTASVGCPPETGAATRTSFFDGPPPNCLVEGASYTALVTTERGEVRIALDVANAPVAVNSFVFLARNKFYDLGSGSAPIGSDGRQIKDYVLFSDIDDRTEAGFLLNISDELPQSPNKTGDVLTALAGPGVIGTQWFVLTATDSASFPTDTPRLGTVISGLDILRTVAAGSSGVGITSVTIQQS